MQRSFDTHAVVLRVVQACDLFAESRKLILQALPGIRQGRNVVHAPALAEHGNEQILERELVGEIPPARGIERIDDGAPSTQRCDRIVDGVGDETVPPPIATNLVYAGMDNRGRLRAPRDARLPTAARLANRRQLVDPTDGGLIVGRGKLEGPQQVRVKTTDGEGKSNGEVVLQALLVDPIVQSKRAAEQTLDTMLELQADYLGYIQ